VSGYTPSGVLNGGLFVVAKTAQAGTAGGRRPAAFVVSCGGMQTTTRWTLAGLGAVSIAVGGWLWWRRKRTATWGRPSIEDQWGNTIHRNPAGVVPGFALRVERVLRRMRADGFDPVVYEAWRSPERARMLAERGDGIVYSMHTAGGAVDIVSESRLWDAPPGFWRALQRASEAEGLYWGGHFGDRPHVQAVPTGRPQRRFIAATYTDRAAMLAA
jgi:hypothetical protein